MVNTAHSRASPSVLLTGNAFLTLLKWAITRMINLVKTSFLVTATLPLHLDTEGDPEKRKSLEAHWVGSNLLFSKTKQMILRHHHLHCCIRYFLPFLFFFAFCWVWLWIVTLPSQLEYFYLERCCPFLSRYYPWMSVSLSNATSKSGYLRGSSNSFAGASVFCLFSFGRRKDTGACPSWLHSLPCMPGHYCTHVFLTSSLKGERFITSTMKESSEYLVCLFSSAFCIF